MNFRLPLQISRVSTLCRSNSPENLVAKFTALYGNHVENQIQIEQNRIVAGRNIINKSKHRTIHSSHTLYDQKAFIHNIADTEKEVSARVRAEQRCDELCPEEPELAFRQTTKVNCCNCIVCKPYLAPALRRPEKLYDDSKCSYNHKCYPDLCNIDPPRMDDLKCYKIKRKCLPCVPDTGCACCMDELKKPYILPILCPPEKYYDPSTLKRDHKNCEEPPCARMDDVCGLKVEPKELPPISSEYCKPCVNMRPLTAPTLCRPTCRYDPTCLPYHHSSCPKDYFNMHPPRRDNWSCEPICRILPSLPCGYCEPCLQYIPMECPVLNRPMPMYDASEMKYKHECPISPCDISSLRRDNVISVTLTKKQLPKLDNDDCKPCCNFRPLTAPALGRPKLFNCNFTDEQERYTCIEEKCIRRDSQVDTIPKCLPPVPKSQMCKPCKDIFTPRRTPSLAPLQKLYDDTCCKYNHKCDPDICEVNPRMDDVRCYQETCKTLPKLPNSTDYVPYIQLPTFAPALCRPCKIYDDTTQKYRHPECPEDLCNIDPPRADNITGIKDEVKVLQTYRPLMCCPCLVDAPCEAPMLCRPRARYDSTCMTYEHKNCPEPCEPTLRRDYFACKVPKKLPKLKLGNVCKECQDYYPTTTPPLNPPCKLYQFPCDPVRTKDCPEECPPRRDDLYCWKPKRKRLPSFNDCDQQCCYSTCSWNNTRDLATQNIKYTIRSKVRYNQILQKNEPILMKRNYSNENYARVTKLQKNEKFHGDTFKTTNINSPDKIKPKSKNITPKKNALAQNNYLVVGNPTWKKIEENENANDNGKYDYLIERWLKENVEEMTKVKSKKKSYKTTNSLMSYSECSQMDAPQNSAVEPLNITPNEFTDYDKSKFCEHFYIKKNNKLQPLKIGSTIKYNMENPANTTKINNNKNECTGKKVKTECTLSIPQKNTTNYVNCKLHHPTKLQNQFKTTFISTAKMTNGDLVLKFNDKLKLKFLNKICNFFKQRENNNKLNVKSDKIKIGPNILGKSLLHANKKGLNKNKSCSLQIKKSTLGSKNKMEIPIRCYSSKLLSKHKGKNKSAIVKNQILPKNSKLNERKFSTSSNGDINLYNHIKISDDYIGKIYKVKLKKIGVKNIMLEKNDPDNRDEEPHTICYICKIVPRHQPIFCDDTPDIKNVNINYYKENRNTIE